MREAAKRNDALCHYRTVSISLNEIECVSVMNSTAAISARAAARIFSSARGRVCRRCCAQNQHQWEGTARLRRVVSTLSTVSGFSCHSRIMRLGFPRVRQICDSIATSGDGLSAQQDRGHGVRTMLVSVDAWKLCMPQADVANFRMCRPCAIGALRAAQNRTAEQCDNGATYARPLSR